MRHERYATGLLTVAQGGIHYSIFGWFIGFYMNRAALKGRPAVFKFCNLIFILNQEVDVIQTIHQTMLLVGIDLESLATSGCLVGHFLFGKIHFHFRLRISSNTAEQAPAGNLRSPLPAIRSCSTRCSCGYPQRNWRSRHGIHSLQWPTPHAHGLNRFRSFACHKNASAIQGIVQYKVLVQGSVGIVAPVAEQIVAKVFLFAGRCLQETGRNDLVGIHIFPKEGAHRCLL